MYRTLSYTQHEKDMKKVRNDVILILIFVFVTAVSAVLYFSFQQDGSRAVVIQNGREFAAYSLNDNITREITDGTNTNVLVIEDGKARVLQATCPDKICVNHRPVSKAGETIVCLPAKLVIEIRK